MNSKAVKLLKNFSYTLMANFVALISSTLVVIIVPKVIGVEDYGYWQLYLFYSSYVGILHFGWNDGVYLRYGGMNYKDINKGLMSSQFYALSISQFIIMLSILFFSSFVEDSNKAFIFCMVAICTLFVNIRYMFLYLLQATNRIKEYARVTIMDRLFYCVLIISIIILGIKDYKLMMVADLTGKFISLVYAMYLLKDIIIYKHISFNVQLKEIGENISAGVKLMLANLASVLIIGVVRFGIEHSWDVETFGKVSLTLSVSNFLMIFINAVGIIMFPILRNTDNAKLADVYRIMRDLLMTILLFILIFYYPVKTLLVSWLPNYSDSLLYMALIFPMCVYEGKMALLINTYFKSLRKEKTLLKINLMSLSVSVIATIIVVLVMKNLNIAVLLIVLILAFRCIVAEIILSKILKINTNKDIILELVMTGVFICTSWFVNSWLSPILYLSAFFFYLSIIRKDLTISIKKVKTLIKTN